MKILDIWISKKRKNIYLFRVKFKKDKYFCAQSILFISSIQSITISYISKRPPFFTLSFTYRKKPLANTKMSQPRPRLGKSDEAPNMKANVAKKQKKVTMRTFAIYAPPKPKLHPELTQFRRFYDRGDLPISRNYGEEHGPIHWKVSPSLLDYHHYLPVFFDGLRETEEPYWFFAFYGTLDLIQQGPSKILPVVPQLVIPLKRALNTKDPEILCRCMAVIQALVKEDPLISEALVPYYRQILPVFNEFRLKNLNLGDRIEYGQRKHTNLGDLINETLEEMEKTGGPEAFINIKYMIPTYQSSVVGGGQ